MKLVYVESDIIILLIRAMILSLMVGVSLNAIGTHTELSYNIVEDTVSAGEFILESSINSQEVFFDWNNLC